MGHLFISYSHKDTGYAHKLAGALQNKGLEVWIDERLDYGSQWPLEIQKQLDSCVAFIVVMTPRAFASEWVQSELQRAKRKLKPVFPLLLEGDEPWLSVESTQYYDVRGEKLPDEKFFSAIQRVTSSQNMDVSLPAPGPKKSTTVKKPKLKTEYVVAIIGAVATILAAFLPALLNHNSPGSLLDSSGQPSISAPTSEAPIVTEVPLVTEAPPEATNAEPQPVSVPASDSEDIVDASGIPMRLVSAGDFTMGSDSGDTDEVPVHTVYLDDFYIDKYEVTNAAYRDCVNAGACYEPQDLNYYGSSQYADHPVIFVDWNMAQTYCEWRDVKLPTEAQWEKAARGTDGRTYPWGEGVDCGKANYLGCSGGTSSVMTYQAGVSPYGVYDMAGNVWEWVADWYSESYYGISPTENPPGPDSGSLRVLRSGAWNLGPGVVRVSLRNAHPPSFYDNDIGFRCARDTNP